MVLEGIYPIVPTPFGQTGAVDLESVERLTHFMMEKGVQGLAVLGALGEGHKLSEAERRSVVESFRRALPSHKGLVVGVRAPATDLAVTQALTAQALGADALLVGPPPVQKEEVLFAFYQRVHDAVRLPIIIHDYPAETGILISVDLMARLHRECERVQYVKLEDPPTGPKMEAVWKRAGKDLKIFGALGGLYALEELERGAVGIMTGFAFPELLVELYRRVRTGRLEEAAELFYDMVALIRFEFQPGIGVSLRKHILVHRGVFRTATVRHPGPEADPTTLAQLFRIVDHLKRKGYDLSG
ncbi:4-hydroxy-tetrahydrodipicolinate synthase [Desulfacinum hydrothermale DSM 13146]|uniref:4-hydroxy-tetrahydrodipicolinate synthase n=1 Tax=Desulfacinum hydrothermale DSM 13146 TaxID=1121390 RepID=A0A1W1XR05_9BACT|nr:dihydrodipicolinate synthase family protein [Desulfacinum hydrothermale]SMC26420.1 4-hydroxy-tetrahydrodipicolinate synthase [Desulfacinum hydrothermale DSM 13146]